MVGHGGSGVTLEDPPKPPPKVARKIGHFIGDLAIFRGILGGVFRGLIWGCFGGVPRMVAG